MRARSVKLREAHKVNNGIPSFCSVLWDNKAHHIVTASSSDNVISVYDPLLLSAAPKLLRHHRDGVTALALSPNSTCLASGSVDHSVKLYKFPSGDFETNITRFTLPIRTLAFNKSGSMLAAAGDDEGIKLINTVDGTISRVLKGHKGTITCLAFDPKSEYLVSADSKGTVIFWELLSGSILHNLKGVAPDTGSNMSIMNVLCWSPDGDILAAPGLKKDVVLYDRDTAEKLSTLRGDHEQSICFLSWSPNSKYIATSGLDNQVIIWDVDKKQDIDRQKFDETICCMSWKPTGNALAVIDVMGKFGVWESVIPPSMKSPTEDIPSSDSKNCNGLLLFDEEEEEPSTSCSLGDDLLELDEPEPTSRKRLRKRSSLDEYPEEDINEDAKLHSTYKKPSRVQKEYLEGGISAHRGGKTGNLAKLQEAFQPGSTPLQAGMRRFLCYNLLGCVTTMEQDGYSHIEIDFHDTSQGPRVPSMTDYFGFSMAALNEHGSVLANPSKGNKSLSTLMYRPFHSWASNSEWSMRFEGEEVKSVALGVSWVAAVTNLNFLRIFSEGGLQKHVISLDGPVVTAVGLGDELAVVTHASHPMSDNDQMLEFRVFNIANGTQPLRGRLPITPDSNLSWFGFSEEGQLSYYDSKGVLRVYSQQFGGSWFPVFSASKVKKPDEAYWVVGLNSEKLFCIVCKSPDLYPKVAPKPVLTLLDLSIPLPCSDLGADALENEFMLRNMHLWKVQKTIDEMAVAGLDTTSLEDEAFNTEAALDRCILRLIASCCNGDKLVRATELMKLLVLEKSMKGAIKLVTALKLPNLAERFNTILEDRMLNEKPKISAIPPLYPSTKTFNGAGESIIKAPVVKNSTTEDSTIMSVKPLISAGNSKPAEGNNSLLTSQFSAPMFRKKAKVQGSTTEKNKAEQGKTGMLDNTQKNSDEKRGGVQANGTEKLKSIADVHRVQLTSSSEKDVRPTNPFAKSSNNQEKPSSSLLDSIKKNSTDRK